MNVSPRTAALALTAIAKVIQLAAPRLNGRGVPADVTVALHELHAASAASGTALDVPAPVVRPCEQLDVRAAATRLGISDRAVRKRIATGRLAARKVGASWLVELEE